MGRHRVVCLAITALAILCFIPLLIETSSFASLAAAIKPSQCNSTRDEDEVHPNATSESDDGLELSPASCGAKTTANFDNIYEKGTWQSQINSLEAYYSDAAWPPKARKSASGPGSDLGKNTQTSLRMVKETIRAYGVESMIDIPCGDANWIFDSWETDSLPRYLGLDIVSNVIALNRKRFAHHRNKAFRYWDAVSCALPRYRSDEGEWTSFDLIHVRDVIQHLPLQEGLMFLCNAMSSGAKVMITTTYLNSKNRNIRIGDFYHNNLASEPFDFPNAQNCTPTHPKTENDLTCVYNLTESWVEEYVQKRCVGMVSPR